jgi:glucan 1,3-beta-glucosidase
MQPNPIATAIFPPNSTWNDPFFGDCVHQPACIKTWGLRIFNSSYIYIYGAGLYSFFNSYNTEPCLSLVNCQYNAAAIEASGYVYLYSLYTVGTSNLVFMDGQQLAPFVYTVNNNTFGQSLSLFGYPWYGPGS